MHLQNRISQNIPGQQFLGKDRERNYFELDNVEFIKDKRNDFLVVLVESEVLAGNEIYVFITGNTLSIEAPRAIQVDLPFRTHLMGREDLNSFESGAADIVFSEIKLPKKSAYRIFSYDLIKPGMLKIVLNSKKR